MSELNQTLWDEFITPYKGNLEKLFASNVWKKSLQPWLKAHREVRIRTVLQTRDHTETDINKGMTLALEMLMNLPEALAAYKPAEKPVQQPATDYSDGLAWDEDDQIRNV